MTTDGAYQRLRKFPRIHTSHITALSFSRDGSMLASSSGDGTLAIFDVKKQVPVLSLHAGPLIYPTCLLWLPDNQLILGRSDGAVQFLEIELPKACTFPTPPHIETELGSLRSGLPQDISSAPRSS